MQSISSPWPWYIAGPLIGLMVPLLLLLGNKPFESRRHYVISARHVFLQKFRSFSTTGKRKAGIFFSLQVCCSGGIIAGTALASDEPVAVADKLKDELSTYGIHDYTNMVPVELFNFESLLSLKGFVLMVVGGFLVGFGTRYAGGCTSGHSIMGIPTLQWPSVIATICFTIGGFIVANLVLPLLLSLS